MNIANSAVEHRLIVILHVSFVGRVDADEPVQALQMFLCPSMCSSVEQLGTR